MKLSILILTAYFGAAVGMAFTRWLVLGVLP